MVKNNTLVEFRGTTTSGWWWQVKSVPPYGTPGPYIVRSGYALTVLGAWWASRRALRDVPTTAR